MVLSRLYSGRDGRHFPHVLRPPTKQISIRLAVSDVDLARKLARQKGVPKYQTYMKTLLHDALIREAQEGN